VRRVVVLAVFLAVALAVFLAVGFAADFLAGADLFAGARLVAAWGSSAV
jgi:hypothetical protein